MARAAACVVRRSVPQELAGVCFYIIALHSMIVWAEANTDLKQ